MKKRSLNSLLCTAAVGVLLLFCSASQSRARTDSAADSVDFTSSNLPIVIIDTHGQTIVDEPKIDADMRMIDNGPTKRNHVTDSLNAYHGRIGIEIRGSSTQMFPKKQYAVETRDSVGNGVDASLLGLPAENDWVLSAPYDDKTLMRDALMYSITRSTGRYASRARFCELVLNNEYMGIYVLFEKPKRTKNRQNVSKLGAADTAGDAVTGGYMIKIDKVEGAGTDGWYSAYPPYPGASRRIYFQYHYPKPEDIVPQQKTYIQNLVAGFESLMATPDYADTATGYATRIDVNSAIDYFLFNEMSKNVDAYRLSAYMYKDRDSKGGKLSFGPIWDFNIAFGNSDYYDGWLTQGYQLLFLTTDSWFLNNDEFQVPFWWKKLLLDPNFRTKAAGRWNTLRASELSWARIQFCIDSLANELAEAHPRNFQRWPVLGQYVWPNYYIGQTYEDEIAYLKSWISARTAWLDLQFPTTGVDDRRTDITRPGRTLLFQNYPNPFNPSTVVKYRVPDAGVVKVVVYDILGREISTLVNERKSAGEHEARFDATGLPSGVYIYRLTAGDRSESLKMVLIE